MANEVELENLIVRLTGDGSSYQTMLESAKQATTEAASNIEEATHHIEHTHSALEGAVHSTEGFAIGLVAAGAIMEHAFGHVAHEALAVFEGREMAFIKLTSVLESNGRAVDETASMYKDFAREMTEVSMTSTVANINLLRTAETFGLTGDAAKQAVENAIALGEATGRGAEGMMRMAVAIAKGDIETAMHMGRMVPQLRGIKDEAEFVAKAHQVMANGLAMAKASMDTMEGASHHLSLATQGLKGDIGEMIAVGLKPVVQWLTEVVQWFRAMPESIKVAIAVVLGLGAATGILMLAAGGMILTYTHVIAQVVAYITWTNLAVVGTYALQAALVVGIVAAGYMAAKGISYLVNELTGYNDAVKESARLSAQLVDVTKNRFAKETARVIGEADAATSPEERKEILTTGLEQAEKEVSGNERNLHALEKQLAETWSAGTRFKEGIKEQKDLLAIGKEAVSKYQAELAKIKSPETNPKLIRDITALNKELELEIRQEGMTASQKRIDKVAAEGATEAMLALASARSEEIEMIKGDLEESKKAEAANKKLQDAMDKEIETISESIAVFHMSAHAKKMYHLETEGASEGDLLAARALAVHLDELERHKSLMDEGKKTTEQFMTPQEKLAEKMATLQEQLDEGAISFETYDKAAEEAAKSVMKAHDATVKFDTILSGSGASFDRIREFQEKMTEQGTATPGAEENRRFYQERRDKKFVEQFGGGPEAPGKDPNTPLLAQMLDELKSINKKPTADIDFAEIA